jgi:hypothetical protein
MILVLTKRKASQPILQDGQIYSIINAHSGTAVEINEYNQGMYFVPFHRRSKLDHGHIVAAACFKNNGCQRQQVIKL